MRRAVDSIKDELIERRTELEATDHALDTARLTRLLHGDDHLQPVIRRLDARLFTTTAT